MYRLGGADTRDSGVAKAASSPLGRANREQPANPILSPLHQEDAEGRGVCRRTSNPYSLKGNSGVNTNGSIA